MDRKEFGLRVRNARKRLHLNKDEFSEQIDISAGFLNEIECGVKGASLETVIKISESTGVTTDYLIFGKENLPNVKTPIVEILERILPKHSTAVLNVLQNIEHMISDVKADKGT
jgi:transcriptional regulator with XRE-family HTH domain